MKDTGFKFVLFTNRKSYTSFQMAPTSVTLNELERRNGCYFAFDTLDRLVKTMKFGLRSQETTNIALSHGENMYLDTLNRVGVAH